MRKIRFFVGRIQAVTDRKFMVIMLAFGCSMLLLSSGVGCTPQKLDNPIVSSLAVVVKPDSATLENWGELKSYMQTSVMGKGQATSTQMSRLLCSKNKKLSKSSARKFAKIYIKECAAEGVNHDLAFCQMCLETNYLRFGGQVSKKQNNFCGLGALDGGAVGASFKYVYQGVRAQVQHLKAYASKESLNNSCIDPRFKLVKRGIAPQLWMLAGKWASDKKYGLKISRKLRTLEDL